MKTLKGRCLCGDVCFSARGSIIRVSACYCRQCQAQNGGGAFYGVELCGELFIENADSVTWYASSEKARRGFCTSCGSNLFWQMNADPSYFDISLGALDDLTEMKVNAHIFVDSCPSYMSVPDTAPKITASEMKID